MSLSCVNVQRLLLLVMAFAVTRGRSSECITGPFDISALAQWSSQYGDTISLDAQSNRQFIFPGVQFRCNGRVTKWIIGAEYDGDADSTQTPVMGVYRDMGVTNQYTRASKRVFVHPAQESPSMLYEYTPDTPQPFQNGDILGLYQPNGGDSRLRVLFGEVDGPQIFNQGTNGDFDDRGLANFSTTGDPRTDRLPLVAVEIESDDPDSADCTRDFISRDLLELLLVRDFSDRQDGHQFLFPSYNFSCDGAITSWSLGEAEWNDDDANCVNFPQLQIWRMNTSSNVHYRVNSTELTATEENTNELYSDTVDPPLEFQVGDVLGMFLPRDDDNGLGRLRVVFGTGGGQTYRTEALGGPLDTIVLGVTSSDRPFLALEIDAFPSPEIDPFPSPTSMSTAITTPPTPAPSLSPPTPAPSLSPPTKLPVTVIAVGAGVGGVAVGVVAVLIVLAAVLCVRKMLKSPNPKDRSVDAINTAATTAEKGTYDNPLQQETTVSTKHNKVYSTSAIATEQNEAYSTSPVATEKSESYAPTTVPNAAYNSKTAVPLQSNEAYSTTRGGSTDEYDYIPVQAKH